MADTYNGVYGVGADDAYGEVYGDTGGGTAGETQDTAVWGGSITVSPDGTVNDSRELTYLRDV